jgi:hypothetical protein
VWCGVVHPVACGAGQCGVVCMPWRGSGVVVCSGDGQCMWSGACIAVVRCSIV